MAKHSSSNMLCDGDCIDLTEDNQLVAPVVQNSFSSLELGAELEAASDVSHPITTVHNRQGYTVFKATPTPSRWAQNYVQNHQTMRKNNEMLILQETRTSSSIEIQQAIPQKSVPLQYTSLKTVGNGKKDLKSQSPLLLQSLAGEKAQMPQTILNPYLKPHGNNGRRVNSLVKQVRKNKNSTVTITKDVPKPPELSSFNMICVEEDDAIGTKQVEEDLHVIRPRKVSSIDQDQDSRPKVESPILKVTDRKRTAHRRILPAEPTTTREESINSVSTVFIEDNSNEGPSMPTEMPTDLSENQFNLTEVVTMENGTVFENVVSDADMANLSKSLVLVLPDGQLAFMNMPVEVGEYPQLNAVADQDHTLIVDQPPSVNNEVNNEDHQRILNNEICDTITMALKRSINKNPPQNSANTVPTNSHIIQKPPANTSKSIPQPSARLSQIFQHVSQPPIQKPPENLSRVLQQPPPKTNTEDNVNLKALEAKINKLEEMINGQRNENEQPVLIQTSPYGNKVMYAPVPMGGTPHRHFEQVFLAPTNENLYITEPRIIPVDINAILKPDNPPAAKKKAMSKTILGGSLEDRCVPLQKNAPNFHRDFKGFNANHPNTKPYCFSFLQYILKSEHSELYKLVDRHYNGPGKKTRSARKNLNGSRGAAVNRRAEKKPAKKKKENTEEKKARARTLREMKRLEITVLKSGPAAPRRQPKEVSPKTKAKTSAKPAKKRGRKPKTTTTPPATCAVQSTSREDLPETKFTINDTTITRCDAVVSPVICLLSDSDEERKTLSITAIKKEVEASGAKVVKRRKRKKVDPILYGIPESDEDDDLLTVKRIEILPHT